MPLDLEAPGGGPNWPMIGAIAGGGVLLLMLVKGKGGSAPAVQGLSDTQAQLGQIEYQGLQQQGMLQGIANDQKAILAGVGQLSNGQDYLNQQLNGGFVALSQKMDTQNKYFADLYNQASSYYTNLYGSGYQPQGPISYQGGQGGRVNPPRPGEVDHFSGDSGTGTLVDLNGNPVVFSGPETSFGAVLTHNLSPTRSGIAVLATQGPDQRRLSAIPSAA